MFRSRLLARGCGAAFQLVLGKRTSAMNSLSGCQILNLCLGVEIAALCDYLFKLRSTNFLVYLQQHVPCTSLLSYFMGEDVVLRDV